MYDRLGIGIHRVPTILLWFFAAVLSVNCEIRSDSTSPPHHLPAGNSYHLSSNVVQECVETFDSEVDYFPEKTALEYAGNFTVEYHRSYKLVTVIEPFPGSDPESYVLLQCGAPLPDLPDEFENFQLIRLPVDQIYLDSTTAIPSLVDLEALDNLKGLRGTRFVTTPSVRERIEKGLIVEYAPAFEIDLETVIQGSPQMLMTDGFNDPAYPKLRNAGIPVVANADWLESTPLGRAEWVKFIALFFNREERAEKLFRNISESYENFVAKVNTVSFRPRVIAGHTFSGTWYAPGGDGFVASIIRDAGGDYILANTRQTSSVETDIESMISIAIDADIWIDSATRWFSVSDALIEDERYREFKAVKNGQIWNYGKIMNESGGVDFFERGVSRPDLVIADLVKIIHPYIASDHEFVWYQKIPMKKSVKQ